MNIDIDKQSLNLRPAGALIIRSAMTVELQNFEVSCDLVVMSVSESRAKLGTSPIRF